MKIPKEIIIAGYRWKIKFDKKTDGGTFSFKDKVIKIGKYNKAETLEILLHEILEALLVARDLRYRYNNCEDDNNNIVFVITHTQFEHLIPDLILALKDFLRV